MMQASSSAWRMPAEWEPHRATWISWPHHEPDWPGTLEANHWVYAEVVRVIAPYEPVEILCQSKSIQDQARSALVAHGVAEDRVQLHLVETDRTWLRDSAPTGVIDSSGNVTLLHWAFNGWAKYRNWQRDASVGNAIARLTGLPKLEPSRPDSGERLVLEGGGIDVNGQGIILVTEEWLLHDVQIRNPEMNRAQYETVFDYWLGSPMTIWLGEGCDGDDTHGHVDDVARFVNPDTIVLAIEEDTAEENHRRSIDNLCRLEHAAQRADIGPLNIVKIPYPRRVMMQGDVLPASYTNFFIGNGIVIVPTFNDPKDRQVLGIFAELMPNHQVVGIHAVDLVLGLGSFHCLTQQEPCSRMKLS